MHESSGHGIVSHTPSAPAVFAELFFSSGRSMTSLLLNTRDPGKKKVKLDLSFLVAIPTSLFYQLLKTDGLLK
jgi:hypothetical protein